MAPMRGSRITRRWRRASAARNVIVLSVGDPDLDTPRPSSSVRSRSCAVRHALRARGRAPALRQAIARAHAARCAQPVSAENVVYFAAHRTRCSWLPCASRDQGRGRDLRAAVPDLPRHHRGLGSASGARSRRCRLASGSGRARVAHHDRTARSSGRHRTIPARGVERRGVDRDRGAGAPARSVAGLGRGVCGMAPGGRVPSLAPACPSAS